MCVGGRRWVSQPKQRLRICLPVFDSLQAFSGLDDIHWYWGGVCCTHSMIQMLIFSRDTLTTPRKNVSPALWASAPSNGHIKSAITTQIPVSGTDTRRPCWVGEVTIGKGTPGIFSLSSDCGLCPTKMQALGISPKRKEHGQSRRKGQMSHTLVPRSPHTCADLFSGERSRNGASESKFSYALQNLIVFLSFS